MLRALLLGFLAGAGAAVAAQALPETYDAAPLPRTTSPEIARKNLDYGIARGARQLDATPADAQALARWLDVLFTRIDMYGTFDDFVAAEQRTARAVTAAPDDADVLIQQARLLQRLHRFDESVEVLAAARARLATQAAGPARARSERAAAAQMRTIDLARGAHSEVLEDLADEQSFAASAVRGAALGRMGRLDAARRAYAEALEDWDGITPFPLAWIEFNTAELYNGRDDARARWHFERALAVLPDYVKARVHLAELVAEADGPEAALAVLAPVLKAQDPEPLARSAEFLAALGRPDAEAANAARRRWDELLERFPLAFADHGAEFYLGAGDDAQRALGWARRNLDNRPTERALGLYVHAALAAQADVCTELTQAPAAPVDPVLLEALAEVRARGPDCGEGG